MSYIKHTLRALSLLAFGALLQTVPSPVHAAPCATFNDVDDTSPFCPSVEWIKNRGVTTGCSTPPLPAYCPNDPVTRLQMAAFLNRLGNVVSPAVYSLESNSGAIDLDVLPARRICVTPDPVIGVPAAADIPAAAYPRRAFFTVTFSGLTAGSLQYRTDLQFSDDMGASWDDVWMNYVNRDGAGGTHWVSSTHQGTVDLAANLPYRFSMTVQREAGGGTADFTDSRCFATIAVYSRTGSMSPFDERLKAPDADR